MALALTSPDFGHMEEMPSRLTCEGEDLSPVLTWTGLPAAAQSLVLIVDDPDAPDPKAPKTTFVHWVLYNIPASVAGLAEGMTSAALPAGTREGLNDWKRTGYGGPCPPVGRHRYFFKLYAVNRMLPDLDLPTKARLEAAMKHHVVERTELVGTYQKTGRR